MLALFAQTFTHQLTSQLTSAVLLSFRRVCGHGTCTSRVACRHIDLKAGYAELLVTVVAEVKAVLHLAMLLACVILFLR
jgi:hypothetical protein